MDTNEENLDAINIACHDIDEIEDCNNLLTNEYKLKILSFNVRSISKNFNNFLVALNRSNTNFDVIILTECRIDELSIIPIISGYNAYRSNKIINQNSGVVVYVRNYWSPTVSEPNFKEADCLIVDIPNTITILAIYRSPSFRNTDSFLADLDYHLDMYKSRPQLVLAGDININITPNNLGNLNTSYLCLNAEHGLLPAITTPTRYGSCLDHIFVKSNKTCLGISCKSDITDHNITIVGLAIKSLNSNNNSHRVILRRNMDGIKSELAEVDWSDIINAKDVNVAVSLFSNRITEIINKHTKKVTISRSKYNLKPWITPGLIRCIRHRDRLHSRATNNKDNTVLQITYKRYRNFCNKLLRKLKIQYESRELQASKGNQKKLWKVIKGICHMSSQKREPLELLHLPNTVSQEESLNICNSHFSTVGHNLANVILKKLDKSEEELASIVGSQISTPNSFYVKPTSNTEVEQLIMQLQNGKAPGIDDFDNLIVKQIKDYILEPLTSIFNLSFSSGTFPDTWKVASIYPIHKAGNKSSPDNYRPISLLGVFSKLLEKLMNKRLVNYLESQNLLSSRQFGFRQKKSTTDALSFVTKMISSYLDDSKACIGVFLDLAKAFDTVSTPVLIKKLANAGIRGLPLEWFKSYLQERKQCLKVGKYKSDLQPVSFGVPQGSILGPTLFILYINDVHNLKISNAEIVCYADDTVILYKGEDWSETFKTAEHGMSQIARWLQVNLLTLNTNKSKYLCFHKTRATSPQRHHSIKIHFCQNVNDSTCSCESITATDTLKYLGVILDHNLNFKTHIATLSGRVRNITRVMRLLRNSAELDALKTVYYALCQSLLTYCITSWGSAAKTIMIQLERAQRSVIKTMLKKNFRYPTSNLYIEAKLLNVRQLFVLQTALFAHKNLKTPTESRNIRLRTRIFQFDIPAIRTAFARRFSPYVETRLYNKILKCCDIKNCSVFEAKSIIIKWLSNLDYDDTENLLKYIT